MAKRSITPTYLLFFILFSPDTWQAVAGLTAAYFITPAITTPEDGTAKVVMVFIMIAAIGYAGTRPIARRISRWLKKRVLGDKIP